MKVYIRKISIQDGVGRIPTSLCGISNVKSMAEALIEVTCISCKRFYVSPSNY